MSRHAHGPSAFNGARFTGIGLVVLIHFAMVWALVSGLVHQAFEAPKPPIVVQPLDLKKPPPPPEPPLQPTVAMKAPELAPLPVPDIPSATEIAPATAVSLLNSTPLGLPSGATRVTEGASGPGGPGTALPIAQPAGAVSPGQICTRMRTPDAPAVQWAGEAVFRVLATVKSGRVTGTEIRALRGSMDAKTRRALQSAIDTTLRSSYECPGDHQFEQEFHFRID